MHLINQHNLKNKNTHTQNKIKHNFRLFSSSSYPQKRTTFLFLYHDISSMHAFPLPPFSYLLFFEFGIFWGSVDMWAAVRRRLAEIPIVLSQTKTKATNWRFWLDGGKKGRERMAPFLLSGCGWKKDDIEFMYNFLDTTSLCLFQ